MIIRLCRPFYCDCKNIAMKNMSTFKKYSTGIPYGYEIEGIKIIDEPRMGSHIGKLRRSLVNDLKDFSKYQKVPYDGYFWWDSDVGATVDDFIHLIKLIRETGLDFIALPYLNHSGTCYVASMEKSIGVNNGHFPVSTKGLLEVHLIGGGFCYTSRNFFESMEWPWWRETIVSVDNGQDITSEDYGLCVQARHGVELGTAKKTFKLYADFSHPVPHGERSHDSYKWT